MHAVDWLPTLANLLGYKPEHEMNWDGQDIWHQLDGSAKSIDGAATPPRAIYTTWNNRTWEAVHLGNMKIVRRTRKPWQLYNLTNDPGETTDLAEQHPEHLQEVVRAYEHFREGDPQ